MKGFLTDVVKDILVTAVCFIIGLFWKSYIYPFFQSFFYNGVNIEGDWLVEQSGTTLRGYALLKNRKTKVSLKQTAYKLKGTAVSYEESDGLEADKNIYDITGEIKDALAIINFKIIDKNKIAKSTFLLQINNNGREMNGDRVFYGSIKNEVNSIACKWRRN